jgi:hypothetical protein
VHQPTGATIIHHWRSGSQIIAALTLEKRRK